jgi:hypothetical protein
MKAFGGADLMLHPKSILLPKHAFGTLAHSLAQTAGSSCRFAHTSYVVNMKAGHPWRAFHKEIS